MYANKFAVAVKHRGKVLQEFGEIVYLPFGSEYGLLLKNLNTVRATVKVSIDGTDATEGVSLVVQPNSSIELERFIKNGNLNAGNRFKFIDRNQHVINHRGIHPEDGLLRVTFAFEVPPQPSWNGWPAGSAVDQLARGGSLTAQNPSPGWNSASVSASAKGAGITAPGGISHQQFQNVGQFVTGQQHVIVLQLAGQSAQAGNIQNVVYTRSKIDCSVCGYKARPTSNFCSQCGASLQIIG